MWYPFVCCTWDPGSGGSVSTEGKPTLYDQDHTAVSPLFGYIEETWVPIPVSSVRSSLPTSLAPKRYFFTGWGGVMEGHLAQGLWRIYHLSWHTNCLEMMVVFNEGPSCARLVRQHNGGLIHKSPGGLQLRPLCKLVHRILLWSQGKSMWSLLVVPESTLFPGHHNIGADILLKQGLRSGEWKLLCSQEFWCTRFPCDPKGRIRDPCLWFLWAVYSRGIII